MILWVFSSAILTHLSFWDPVHHLSHRNVDVEMAGQGWGYRRKNTGLWQCQSMLAQSDSAHKVVFYRKHMKWKQKKLFIKKANVIMWPHIIFFFIISHLLLLKVTNFKTKFHFWNRFILPAFCYTCKRNRARSCLRVSGILKHIV